MDLSGKVAAITGGSRGIGRGIAEALLSAGAMVTINGRNQEKGDQAIVDMAAGDRAKFIAGDVTRQSDVENFVQSTIDHFGRIDILVNNAGGSGGFAPVAEMSEEAWQEAAAWILHSAFWGTRIALRDMESRGWGRIINISSVEGKQANKENVSHYITFKHALNGFTKAVAFEYGTKGITSNAISPGAVETDLMKEAGPSAAESAGITYEQFKENYAQDAAIKRLNTVEEVAGMALFLTSDLGAGVTGAILPVDGGSAL
ncbi:MAG: SDR family oxidoreductase [Gammaproteobacteria bacterium]|nr:SDR family oxidoreductase [Gammaproteobacteria bacterium]MBT4494142.1 SDR family oxidoreductase [Gammaproteobacteria bacterium]MBT7372185.1 SDR family oxidoreductase [Gammaproteobacteria bacterium]